MDVTRGKYSCKFPGCPNKYYSVFNEGYKNKGFHRFPKRNLKTLEKWRNICEISPEVNCSSMRVCRDHFLPNDYLDFYKRRLRIDAVPVSTISIRNSVLWDHDYVSDPSNNIAASTTVDENSSFADRTRIETDDEEHFETNYSDASIARIFTLPLIGSQSTKIHKDICSKILTLKNMLEPEKNKLLVLKVMYDEGNFESILKILDLVTKEFVDSKFFQYNYSNFPDKEWTIKDQTLALSLFKRSPKLYRYLRHYFKLPSTNTLEQALYQIPFETDLNDKMLPHLTCKIEEMHPDDRNCVLLFDDMPISSFLQYDEHKQTIFGFEDLGELGRSRREADHVLIFMVRGIRKSWKQVVAYYFTCSKITKQDFKIIVNNVISRLQAINLKILATVCDQNHFKSALEELSLETNNNCDNTLYPHTFKVNNQEVHIIIDVPHLLESTRNAMLKASIQFDKEKYAKFLFIEQAFCIDQSSRRFSLLPRLKEGDFKDYVLPKKKIKVAARQLSFSTAAAIESFVETGLLPLEASFTAEFASIIDTLFDLLNSTSLRAEDGKPNRCAISEHSPHLAFFSELLIKMLNWKLLDLSTGENVTDEYGFIAGWQISLTSIIDIWDELKRSLIILPTRVFNLDPVKNTLCFLQGHEPTAREFVGLLKTLILNDFSTLPIETSREEDCCKNLLNVSEFLNENTQTFGSNSEKEHFINENSVLNVFRLVVDKVLIPECSDCRSKIYASSGEEINQFIRFNRQSVDRGAVSSYSHTFISIYDYFQSVTYKFLETNAHAVEIENKIMDIYGHDIESFRFCQQHDCHVDIIKGCVKVLIYKFINEKNRATKTKS